MIRPYWSSEDRWAARGLLLGVVLLTLAMVYLTVLLNQWNNAFYSALQDKNMAAFRGQLFRVTWLITIFIYLAVYQEELDRKSTRLNSSHTVISYAVFCLKKKKTTTKISIPDQ